MAGWKNSVGTGNRGEDAPGEKWLGGTDSIKRKGRRTEIEEKKVEESSDFIFCLCYITLSKVSGRVNKGYPGACTPGQEASVWCSD